MSYPDQVAMEAHSEIVRAIQIGDQAPLARTMGVSPSTVSRALRPENLATTLRVLAHVGYRMVPIGSTVVDDKDLDFMRRAIQRVMREAPEMIFGGTAVKGNPERVER